MRARFAALAVLLTVLLAGCTGAAPIGVAPGAPVPATAPVPVAAQPATSCPAPSPTAPGRSESRLPLLSLCALPPEAGQVWRVVSTGGRLSYPQDGTTFQNFERRLPSRKRGYYREYTVPTPGSPDRGARRFVAGQRFELFYTGDHYRSFVVVDSAAVGS